MTPPTSCQNGGQLISPVGTGESPYCYCLGLFTGAQCEKIVCMNGGTTSNVSNTCTCPTGFTGFHCEDGEGIIEENLQSAARNGRTSTLILVVQLSPL